MIRVERLLPGQGRHGAFMRLAFQICGGVNRENLPGVSGCIESWVFSLKGMGAISY